MIQLAYKTRPQRRYTIDDARADIEYLGKMYDTLEAERQSLQDEVDQLRRDEWRALYLCNMLKRRVDVLERVIDVALTPEGKKYITHQVITELRTKQSEVHHG